MRVALAFFLLASAGAAAQSPDWQPPPPGTYPEAMTITGVVQVSGRELRSRDDRLAAFVEGEVRGVTASTLVGSRRVFFLSVAGTLGDGDLTFRAYDALDDRVREVQPMLGFDPARPVGTVGTPVVWTPYLGGGPPAWTVTPSAFPASMTLTGQVTEAGVVVGESGALVAAFLDGELRGVAPIQATTSLAFLTVYGTSGETGDLAFRVYRPSADRTFAISASVPLSVGTTVGTPSSPAPLPLRLGRTLGGPEGWQMLAPPGADATVETVLGHLWTQGFLGARASHGASNVRRYVEPLGDYASVGSASEAWPRGEGRLVYVYADDDPRTGPVDGGFPKTLPPAGLGPVEGVTFALTRTNGNGAPEGPGWNMLGNPFDDPIDWDLGWTRTGVGGSVYVWDPAYMGGGYRVWNGTTGSLTDGIIPRGSGFWARRTDAGAVLRVPASARVGAMLPRVNVASSAPVVHFTLHSEERVGLGTDAWVTFQDGATDGVDAVDTWVLAPLVADYVALGTVSPEAARLLAVDVRSSEVAPSLTVPLAVGAVADGEPVQESLVLRWPSLDVPETWTLTLVDTETGTEVDVREAGAYRFTVGTTGSAMSRGVPLDGLGSGPDVVEASGPARFLLHVSTSAPTGTSPGDDRAVMLGSPSPNPSRGSVSVAFTLATPGAARLDLVDALGRRIVELAAGRYAAGSHIVQMDVSHLPPGTYRLRLLAEGHSQTRPLTVLR